MKNAKRFFKCSICGKIIDIVEDKGPIVVCCGKKMDELVANTTEAAEEKHIPEVQVNDNKVRVQVGSILHPMIKEHYIGWVYVQTNKGGQYKSLEIDKDPVVEFALTEDEKVLEVYAYCNLHGLWKIEL